MPVDSTQQWYTKGIARVKFIFENLPEKLRESLPETMYDFGEALRLRARANAMSFSRTGRLVVSIEMSIAYQGDTIVVRVGPTILHGPFVSWGTRAHWIGANIEVAPNTWRWIGMHPGHGGNPYLEWSLTEVLPFFPKFLQRYVTSKVLELGKESLPLEFEE